MPFDLFTNHRKQRIEVRYYGLVTAEERRRAVDQALGEAGSGLARVLVDFTLARYTRDDFDACNRLASLLARETWRHGARVAYVVREEVSMNPEIDRLTEARGVPARKFRDVEDAIAWLQQRVPDEE